MFVHFQYYYSFGEHVIELVQVPRYRRLQVLRSTTVLYGSRFDVCTACYSVLFTLVLLVVVVICYRFVNWAVATLVR